MISLRVNVRNDLTRLPAHFIKFAVNHWVVPHITDSEQFWLSWSRLWSFAFLVWYVIILVSSENLLFFVFSGGRRCSFPGKPSSPFWNWPWNRKVSLFCQFVLVCGVFLTLNLINFIGGKKGQISLVIISLIAGFKSSLIT